MNVLKTFLNLYFQFVSFVGRNKFHSISISFNHQDVICFPILRDFLTSSYSYSITFHLCTHTHTNPAVLSKFGNIAKLKQLLCLWTKFKFPILLTA